MFDKLKGKLSKSAKAKAEAELPTTGFTFGDPEEPQLVRGVSEMGTFRRKRRKSRCEDMITLSEPTNSEMRFNPMNIFDHELVSRGWPLLKYEGCPIPHSIRAVTTRVPTREEDEFDDNPNEAAPENFSAEAVDWYTRYKAFYKQYCPSKMDSVGTLLQQVYDKGADPADLWAKMLIKYGTTEETWMSVDWEDRLQKFYTIHAKDKLETVPHLLEAIEQGADMHELWKKMLTKYGVTEHNWESEIDWLRRFTAFYYIHCKEKVDMVPKLLQQLDERGAHPLELWQKMLDKYEVTEDTWREQSSKINWHERFTTFYNIHAPDRKETVEQLLRHVADRGAEPADLWPKLLEKYDLTEEDWFVVPESAAEKTEIDWEGRFTSLLSIHAPHQVHTVPELLVQEKGSLDLVWKLLLEQYNVTEDTWDKPRKSNPWKRFLMAVSVSLAFKKALNPRSAEASPGLSVDVPDTSPRASQSQSPTSNSPNMLSPTVPSPDFPSSAGGQGNVAETANPIPPRSLGVPPPPPRSPATPGGSSIPKPPGAPDGVPPPPAPKGSPPPPPPPQVA